MNLNLIKFRYKFVNLIFITETLIINCIEDPEINLKGHDGRYNRYMVIHQYKEAERLNFLIVLINDNFYVLFDMASPLSVMDERQYKRRKLNNSGQIHGVGPNHEFCEHEFLFCHKSRDFQYKL
jgi:hypothetical protein